MNLFKAVHIRKKHILIAFAAVACIGVCTCLIPPTAARVSALVSAKTERKLPIYCVETDKPQVSISFDAAWGADDTDELLRILADNNVKATFFLCGYWVEDYPDEVKKIAEAGHDLGNHSSTHPHMNQLNSEQISKELADCHKTVKDLTGMEMDLFRPPFGEYNNTVIETAFANSYYPIQWNVDSLDWKELGADHELNQVLNHKHLSNGSIILFHNDAKYTPEVLDAIIKGLKEKGYELVPISQLIYRDNFELDHEGRQKKSTSAT